MVAPCPVTEQVHVFNVSRLPLYFKAFSNLNSRVFYSFLRLLCLKRAFSIQFSLTLLLLIYRYKTKDQCDKMQLFSKFFFFFFFKTRAENFLQAKIPFESPMYKSRAAPVVGRRKGEMEMKLPLLVQKPWRNLLRSLKAPPRQA